MPDWFSKAFEHTPDLLALIMVVVFFLKFTTKLLESHNKRTDEFIQTVKDINSAHAQEVRDMRSAMDRQAVAAEEMRRCVADNTQATRELTTTMRSKA